MPFKAAFVFCILAFSNVLAGDDAAKDLKAMQGSWVMVELEVNGQKVPMDKLEGAVLTVKGGMYSVKVKKRDPQICTITLDAKKSPRHIDMVFQEGEKKDKLHKAIYRFDGGKLHIARGLNADQERPDQFATWPDTNYFVVTWQRQPAP